MTAILRLPVVPPTRSRLPSIAQGLPAIAWVTLGLMVAALLLRMPGFGDPDPDIDEDFYLLVGDRLLHGAIPYVDIWDRKPIGLFLLYAAMRALGGNGLLAYQVGASLFAGGTAAIIAGMARRPAGWIGGIGAGLAYLLWIETLGGSGGQAPVFYNLPIAAAGWATLRACTTADGMRFRRLAFLAMACAGLAIQIKYTALFEAAYFGMLLAWACRRHATRPIHALATVLMLAATALAPTGGAILAYAAIGHLDAFWFANFVSIFHRAPSPRGEIGLRLGLVAMHLLPFAVCAAASIAVMLRRPRFDRVWLGFVAGWILAALVGFFSIGALYIHYALPLFVPFAIAAAPIFRRVPLGWALLGLMLWMPASHLGYPDFATTGRSKARIDALATLLPADVATGCLHMFAGPPVLYRIGHACFVSRFLFPDHLVGGRDAGAIGVDPTTEVERIFRARPRAIVTTDMQPAASPAERRMRALRDRLYVRAGGVAIRGWIYDVWVRR